MHTHPIPARAVSVMREPARHAHAQESAELFEMQGVPGFMVFHCERLCADLSPKSCGANYASPRNAACVSCSVGQRHHAEHGAPEKRFRPTTLDASHEAHIVERQIGENLKRRHALNTTGGETSALDCIRCGTSSATNERYIGKVRLVGRTRCISCYNREREYRLGFNAKGRPVKKIAGKLFATRLIVVENGSMNRLDIGLSTGIEEAKRHADRIYPNARLVGAYVSGEYHPVIEPYGEGFTAPKIGKPRKDIAGQRVGRLVAKEYVGGGRWRCTCDCGRESMAYLSDLMRGTVSCGCYRDNLLRLGRDYADVAGKVINGMTAERYLGRSTWAWVAECGCKRVMTLWRAKHRGPFPCRKHDTEPATAIEAIETPSPMPAPAATAPAPRKLAVGARFGSLALRRDVGRQKWLCACDCGRSTTVHATMLRGGQASCGCVGRTQNPAKNRAETAQKPAVAAVRAGVEIGYWRALQPVRGSLWRWKCTCGTVRTIDASTIKKAPRHCGCGGARKVEVEAPGLNYPGFVATIGALK